MKAGHTAIHYEQDKPPREVTITEAGIYQEYWIKTNKGPLFAASLFPIHMMQEVLNHYERVKAARAKLNEVTGEIYTIINASSQWRKSRE